MANLFSSMTDAVMCHWKANNNAYPQKFVLSPTQHISYVESRRSGIGGPNVGEHMGVPIEVVEGGPGVMVAANGAEVSLL